MALDPNTAVSRPAFPGDLDESPLGEPVQLNKPADVDALRRAIDTFDETKARELARDFVRYGTWHCPTLIRVRTQEQCDHHTFSDDPDLGYVTPKVRKVWEKASRRFTKKFSEEQRAVFDDLYQL